MSIISDFKQKADISRLPHALLIEGIGLELNLDWAKSAAQAAVCSGDDKPCGECPGCVKAMKGIHPDIFMHTAPDKPAAFHIDIVRQVISDVYIKPNEADKKVYILGNAHSMTVQAQNALLKVLEEPPHYAVFILTAENRHRMLNTILSRSVSVKATAETGGTADESGAMAADVAIALTDTNELSLMALLGRFEKDKDSFRTMLDGLVILFSNSLIHKTAGQSRGEYEDVKVHISDRLTSAEILSCIEAVKETRALMNQNANQSLLITAFCANLRASIHK